MPDQPPSTPHTLQRRPRSRLRDGHRRYGVGVGARRCPGEVEHRLPHPGRLERQVGTRQRSLTQVFQTAVEDQDTVQGGLLIRQLHLTDPEEGLADRLRRQFLTGHGRSLSRQRGHQLTGSHGSLPQREGPLGRSGMGRQPCRHACEGDRLRSGASGWVHDLTSVNSGASPGCPAVMTAAGTVRRLFHRPRSTSRTLPTTPCGAFPGAQQMITHLSAGLVKCRFWPRRRDQDGFPSGWGRVAREGQCAAWASRWNAVRFHADCRRRAWSRSEHVGPRTDVLGTANAGM